MSALARLLALLCIPFLAGCQTIKGIGLSFVYDRADLPGENVRMNLAYVDGTQDDKQRLNFFLPLADSVRGTAWPTVVFVHGGGWNEGDRNFEFGGEDLYNNVGRFLAGRGIGASVVSYRLLPGVTLSDQIADVARAAAFTRQLAADAGGDPNALILMGHSAGAHLATYVALDTPARQAAGLPSQSVCGVIPVSGAALDLTDRRSFEIAEDFDYYGSRFGPRGVSYGELPPDGPPSAWQADASVLPLVDSNAPPFLVMHAGGDYPALIRQAELLVAALREADVSTEYVVVPGKSHSRIIPTLSRDDQAAGPAMLRFIRGLNCE